MENLGGVIFFAVVLVMFGVTAYLYFYGDDLNLKFWGSDSDGEELGAENDSVAEIVNETEPEVEINESEVNDSMGNVSVGNESEMNETVPEVVSLDYPNWDHRTITYKILDKQGCWTNPIQSFEEAVSLIEDGSQGAIDFLEVVGAEYDIEVRCVDKTSFLSWLEANNKSTCSNVTYDYNKQDFDPVIEGNIEVNDYYISDRVAVRNDTASIFTVCYYDTSEVSAGNYTWEWFFESTPEIEEGVILSHSISIFDEASYSRCAAIPTRELHELFHGLGFAHVDTPPYYPGYGWSPVDFPLVSDVMFEYRYCTFQKKIQQKYFDCLQKIYLGAEKECEDVNFLEG